MLRRTLLAAIGLAAVICLGGCTLHGNGHNGVRAGTKHHPRVFNVRSQSYSHTHHGSGSHSHAGGHQTHSHDKPAKNDQDYPAHHRGYHEDGNRGNAEGHTKRHTTRHAKRHDKDKD